MVALMTGVYSIIMASVDVDLEEALSELSTLPEEPPTKREVCARCKRPPSVCICSCFPPRPLQIRSRVIVLQHPSEESRCLATVPLFLECVAKERVHVIRGKRFGMSKRFEVLRKALESEYSLLLYPGRSAVNVTELPRVPVGEKDSAALLVLDGTWAQAKSIFAQNPILHNIRQVELSGDVESVYVIRTQPNQGSLSTLESIVHTLAWLEQDPSIVETSLKPLKALCQYQLDHGAVRHHSKDHPDYIPRWLRKSKRLDEEKAKSNEESTMKKSQAL